VVLRNSVAQRTEECEDSFPVLRRARSEGLVARRIALFAFFALSRFSWNNQSKTAMEEETHDASSDSEASSGEISEGQSEEEDFDEEALLGDDAQDGVDFDVDSYKKAPEPTKEDMLRDGIRQILSGVNLSALLAGTEEDEEALRMEDKYQRRAAKMKKKEKKQKKADKKEDDTKKESGKKEKVDKKVPKKGTGEEKDKKAASATIESTKKEPKSKQQKEPQKKGEEKEKAAEATTQSSQKKRKRSDTETDPQATSEKSTSATNASPAKNQKKLDDPSRRKFRVKPSEAKPVAGMFPSIPCTLAHQSFYDRETIEGICRMPAM